MAMRVGVDLDGVGYAWEKTARFLLKWYRGYDLGPSTTWDSIENSITKDDWRWLWSDGVEKFGIYRHGHILAGFKEAIDEIAKSHRVVIITARPPIARQDTLDWLAYHRINTGEVHILGKEPKSSIPCDAYIDDGPHNLKNLVDAGVGRVICWAQPYNKDAPCNLRTNSWREAIDYIG